MNYFPIFLITLILNSSVDATNLVSETSVDKILAEAFPQFERNDITVSLLKGGLSGAGLYKIATNENSYVLRLQPSLNNNTELPNELFALIKASKMGLSPVLQYISDNNQAILMEYIALPTLTLEQAKSPQTISKIADAIRLAHTITDYPQHNEEMLSKAIRCHHKVLNDNIGNKEDIDAALRLIKEGLKELESYAYAKVHLHGDLNPRNIFLTSDKVLFIDWAETSFADPFSDLTYFALKLDYDTAQQNALLSYYLQRDPTSQEQARFTLNKKIHQAFWSLTNLYLADIELNNNPNQLIEKNIKLKNWGDYQKISADGMDLTAQYFFELSLLNFQLAK